MKCPKCHRFFLEQFNFCPYDGSGVVEREDLAAFPAQITRYSDTIIRSRYQIRGFIGKGGMARVYLAEDVRTGSPVAVKVLEKPFRKDPDVRERFWREACSASVIGHPSIVRVLDSGEREEDGAPFLVMEYLVGETVGAYLRRDGKMRPDLALPAMRQAADALAATHRVGIVHRDIKPDNLFLIGEPGDPYELKIVDFGLARSPNSMLTSAGLVLGTPAYMAPEQVVCEPVDARTDIYALGMVMYLALAGRGPFEGRDEVETMGHQLYTPPARPSKYARDIDPWLEAILIRAMRKTPDERYQTMEELIFDLDCVTDGAPPSRAPADPPVDHPYRPRTTVGALVAKSIGRTIGLA